jgi:formylglycine-generating enzyme required for sulfatase activity
MKRNLLKLITIAVLFVAFSTACSKEKYVTSVTLSQTKATLTVGESITLTATVSPEEAINKNVSWTTNNEKVATVKDGLVTAKAEGTVTITVTTEDGKKTANCTVIVLLPGESEMIRVEGGTFIMGQTDDENPAYTVYERPAHQVTLNAFKIAKYPVTQKQWMAIMDDNPSYFKGDDLPVTNVSWHDAQTFTSRLSEATGKNYRLPTEAEWEYACRGGASTAKYKYSGSNDLNLVGWYSFNSEGKTHPVGKKAGNELGIKDMSGNVWEWCRDWAAEYTDQPQTNPQGPETGTCRVNRGGSYLSDYLKCRVSFRSSANPDERSNEIGFRIVLQE